MNEDALFTARLIRTAMGHLGVSQSELAKYLKSRGRTSEPVSYTHLTLPTNSLV